MIFWRNNFNRLNMNTLFYKIVFESQEEGGFTVYAPKLPGCVSEGETYDEAISKHKRCP